MQEAFSAPARLLMGPGPVNADPRVLRAMSQQMIGQYDPAILALMDDTQALYRRVFETGNRQTFLVDGTSRAGIEALLISIIRPGDPVLVASAGRFGMLLTELARRAGAQVTVIDRPWGEVFTLEEIEAGLRKCHPRILLTVHGDTSTTMLQPLEGVGELCREYGALFYTDATATLGGNLLPVDALGLDAVSAGLQKCLGGPAGTSPVTVSPRYEELCRRRTSIELGSRESSDEDGPDPVIPSNYFDMVQLMEWWGSRRLNHHTEATTALYAAHECARLLVAEGVAAAAERHRRAGEALLAGVRAMGLQPFGDLSHRMNNVLGVVIPEGIDGAAVQRALLTNFGLEIGSSFGPLRGRIWRIGTMGANARRDCVLTTLAALESVLLRMGHRLTAGAAVRAAWEYCDDAGL